MLVIICTLGRIGDKRALPALRYMESREDIELHGSIYAALDRVIYKLSSPQGK
jgi:hypothetical protein